jgi:ribonucleoside-triphosphate reductase
LNKSVKILSDITVYSKYAKFDKKKKRRETWEEICYRNMAMNLQKYPQLYQEILDLYNNFVIPKKVLPSMRSMQFGGRPIELSPNRIFNCCFFAVDHYKAFSEAMFLLLGGSGVGYSVQRAHVAQLPEIKKPLKKRRFLVEDSIVGWADAVKALTQAYFFGKSLPQFDFSDIRPKGAELITSGGKAPGPEPLKTCLFNLQRILDRKENGEKLTTIEVHDMICFIADAVLSGGIRRAALISLFDIDDSDMLTCKFGNWWEENPQRGRANNSAVVIRHKITEEKFQELWGKIQASGSGEPGIYFSNNTEWGTNPCCEIALRNNQFCNLTEINASDILDQSDLEARAKAAAFLGTLQAGYTDFHYLRDVGNETLRKTL